MSDRLLVLVRHGQSEWNLKNLFTGWKDPDLTEQGIAEAKEAGRKLKAQGLTFDTAFTSVLLRAQHTLDLMLAEIGQTGLPTTRDLALNERDYGDLSGLNKDDARKKWGEDQVLIWRRSYDVPPPGGESLKDTLARDAALLRQGNPARRVARRADAGRRPRQLAARADHGAGEAFAGADSEARTRHRRAGDLPAQCGFDGGVEARSGGVNCHSGAPEGRTRNLEVPGSMLRIAPNDNRESMHAHLSGFPAEHRLFPRDAPVIAGQRAAFAERAMARHHERYRISADGGADRA